ncbi:hypothetical protein OSTOST_09820, partial [Ostertagia ostertagi]
TLFVAVSHVKVLDKETIQDGDPLSDVQYTLEHLEVFKYAEQIPLMVMVNRTLNTSQGQLYLGPGGDRCLLFVCGSFYNDLFHTSTCGQIVTDEPSDNFSGGLMEWTDISATFLSRLKSFTC